MQEHAYDNICNTLGEFGSFGLETFPWEHGRAAPTFSCRHRSATDGPWRSNPHARTHRPLFGYHRAGPERNGSWRSTQGSGRSDSKTGRWAQAGRAYPAQNVRGPVEAGGSQNRRRSVQRQEVGSLELCGNWLPLAGHAFSSRSGNSSPTAKKTGHALHACFKRFTGPPHPDRDRQFRFIEQQRETFQKAGCPILSVDTKKKELIGNFANAGRTWGRQALEVNAHDFKKDATGRAVPYGMYEPVRNTGHVRVGSSGDTPRFAVASIAHWWKTKGRYAYPGRRRLLLLPDAGGSNDCRKRAWKYHLQKDLADRFGLRVSVSHLPTGASKWNPVEHRLFGPISINWAGQPLTSFGKLLQLIRGTKTVTASASFDRKKYEVGEKICSEEMAKLKFKPGRICPTWNYTFEPSQLIHKRKSLASGP